MCMVHGCDKCWEDEHGEIGRYRRPKTHSIPSGHGSSLPLCEKHVRMFAAVDWEGAIGKLPVEVTA